MGLCTRWFAAFSAGRHLHLGDAPVIGSGALVVVVAGAIVQLSSRSLWL
jgi:hypothetical protein